MSPNWQNRIYKHEEAPPDDIWEKIAGELDQKNTGSTEMTKSAPVRSIFFRRWAVAASILFIAGSAIYLLRDKQNNPRSVSIKQYPIPASAKATKDSATTIPGTSNIIPAAALANSKETLKNIEKTEPLNLRKQTATDLQQQLLYVKNADSTAKFNKPTVDLSKKLKNMNGEETNDIALMDAPHTYISFIGPNGQEVKISSKFSSIIGYLSNNNPSTEEYLDKIISESAFWRTKFKTWRDKMSSNTLSPSPTNLMDIIELCKLLSEENK